MIEGSARPVGNGGAVAQRAILRESGGGMRRIRGSVVIGLVAILARRAVQGVVIIDVARAALLRGVHSHQRETGGRMVESRAEPVRRRVAPGAVLREVRGLMRRIGGAVVVGLVAVPARTARQAVIVVHVALRALHAGMRAGQREAGGRVIESGAGPVRDGCAMAQSAILREAG